MGRMSRGDSKLRAVTENTPVTPASRITVALVDKAATDLQTTHARTGLSKTDIVNRAVSLYEFIDVELGAGAELIVRRNGKDHIIKLL
jgi:hypothetical protein